MADLYQHSSGESDYLLTDYCILIAIIIHSLPCNQG